MPHSAQPYAMTAAYKRPRSQADDSTGGRSAPVEGEPELPRCTDIGFAEG